MRRSGRVCCAAAVLGGVVLCGATPGCGETIPLSVRTTNEPTRSGFINSIGMKLVYIKPGTFLMGSPASESGRFDNEGPQHRVTLTKGFHMGAHQVTQQQYGKVMGTNPSHFRKGGNHPVEKVSWSDAQEFCRKLSARDGRTYRLPSEAEWEYACRAGTTTPFAFGNTISTEQANYDGNYPYARGQKGEWRRCTTPVGSFQPNAWGLCDMHGNLYEWCSNWYDRYYYQKSAGNDPEGPSSGSHRVVRGGSWYCNPRGCRSAYRDDYPPGLRVNYIGFRLLCVFPPAR